MANTITVIDSKNQKFQFDVHATGCRDLKKYDIRRQFDTMKFKSLDHMNDTMLDTGDENAPGWSPDDLRIYPCASH